MIIPSDLHEALTAGRLIPYIGPGVLALDPACPLPATPEALVSRLVEKVAVPHKIRGNLTAAASSLRTSNTERP